MKNLVLLLYVLITPFWLVAQSNEELLQQLDQAIANKATYQAIRYASADSLNNCIRKQTGAERIATLWQLYQTYLHFQSDSTLSILNHIKALPEYTDDAQLQQQVRLQEAQVYGMMGLYSTAFDMMNEARRCHMDSATLLIYYSVQHAVLGWMSEFSEKSAPGLALRYKQQAITLHDSLLLLEPDPINRSIIHSNRDYDHAFYDAALDTLQHLLSTCDDGRAMYVYSNLSQIYHQMQETDREMHYLILTSIADIQAGVTEYMALPILASLLNEQGDIDRAYNYLYCAFEDANISKASLRALEVSEIFPIIHRARQQQLTQQRSYSISIITLLTLLAIALTTIVFVLLRLNRKLQATRSLLANANNSLKESNHRLQQIDKQKSSYLQAYLTRSRNYLSSAEAFQKQMLNLLQTKKLDELQKQLKSTRQNEEEEARFLADFDQFFLNLYPDFVEKFNSLLKPEARIQPKNGDLLTTELRLFALIRMGETDSSRIAKFLNYSLTTIYNYRSRTRNNAIGDKDKFEEAVMAL